MGNLPELSAVTFTKKTGRGLKCPNSGSEGREKPGHLSSGQQARKPTSKYLFLHASEKRDSPQAAFLCHCLLWP